MKKLVIMYASFWLSISEWEKPFVIFWQTEVTYGTVLSVFADTRGSRAFDKIMKKLKSWLAQTGALLPQL